MQNNRRLSACAAGNPSVIPWMLDMASAISIVIPVYNGAACLDACLQAIRRLRPAPLECIVVDDGSTDNSASIARQACVTVVSLPDRQGPATARNLGARAALGEILLFLDADVLVSPDALNRVAARFAVFPKCDAVIGSYDSYPASPDLISQYRNLLHCYTHQSGKERTCLFWTGCGAIRTSVFRSLGGFEETRRGPSMEDVELGMRVRRAGGEIWLDKQLQVKHLKHLNIAGMVRTDIWDRAIPWTRLILRWHEMPADLNLKWAQRFSVLASAWGTLAIPLALLPGALPTGPLLLSSLLAALLIIVLNRGFYRFLAMVRSPWLCLRAFPFHCLYFLCCGAGFAAGFAMHHYMLWTGKSAEPDTVSQET